MRTETEAPAASGDHREKVSGVDPNSGDAEGRWSACAVLAERLRLLQLRGRALGTRLGELRKAADAMGHAEPESSWESKGLSSSPREGEAKPQRVASPGERPFFSYPSYAAVRVRVEPLFAPIDGGSPQRPGRFQEAGCSLPAASPAGHGGGRGAGQSPSPPIIIVEVMDSDAAACDVLASVAGEEQGLAVEGAEPHPATPPVAAAVTQRPRHDGSDRAGQQAHISFLVDQIQQIDAPARLASPAVNVFRRIREGPRNQGEPENKSIPTEDSGIQAIETTQVAGDVAAVADAGQTQPPARLDAAASAVDNGTVTALPAEGLASATPMPCTTCKIPSLSPSSSATRAFPTSSPLPSAPVGLNGACESGFEPSQSAVDYEAKARELLQRGEWKKAEDTRGKVYYYHAKERRSCWNLAKELRRLAGA
ncbi:uncharacterized protein Tco025E_03912 [Trypanosoma conorhini]|uniref:WW domain-containing protein n=1 Tax=Trypanosoma conorhini TaxID=83891 RepID=A0A422PQY2_9TRYP|nr:uncharacterized protein Tco025E_03912 [Trypanosoma conorhini]RNF20134.1 hypothetical protein Tco025E_03912 [Trypanosoma conorhini]